MLQNASLVKVKTYSLEATVPKSKVASKTTFGVRPQAEAFESKRKWLIQRWLFLLQTKSPLEHLLHWHGLHLAKGRDEIRFAELFAGGPEKTTLNIYPHAPLSRTGTIG